MLLYLTTPAPAEFIRNNLLILRLLFSAALYISIKLDTVDVEILLQISMKLLKLFFDYKNTMINTEEFAEVKKTFR